MDDDTICLMARHYLGENSPRDYSDWAVACLEKGFDTKNIRILASMFNAGSFAEIEINFRRAITELGLEFPSRKDFLLLTYTKFIAKQIVENQIEPYEGCHRIYRIFYAVDYPETLRNWMYLDEGLAPETYEFLMDSYDQPEVTEALNKAIVKEAKELLKDDYFSRSPRKQGTAGSPAGTKKETLFGKIWKKFFS